MRVHVSSSVPGLADAAAAACSRLLPSGLASGLEWQSPLSEAEVILADPGVVVDTIGEARRLRWMQSTWAGVNALVAGTAKRDYVVTRAAGCFGQQMAGYVLGHILVLERRLHEARRLQLEGRWDQEPFRGLRRLGSLTVGLLGCGDLGGAIARGAKAIGLRTVGFRRDAARGVEGVDVMSGELAPVLAQADFVVNTLPSTPETAGLLSGDALKPCAGRGVTLINVGRGDICTEEDILGALATGRLAKAVLDVFPVEPLPQSSPLWRHPDVLLTPHISAVSLPEDVADIFARNLRLYLETPADAPLDPTKLRYAVSWERGY